MAGSLHPLLLRQLRRLGLDPDQPCNNADKLPPLLERVSRAYADADQGRYLLEHSQEVVSQEMHELYARLEASQARLSSLLMLSSDWVWEQDEQLRFTHFAMGQDDLASQINDLVGMQRQVRALPPVSGSDPDEFEQLVEQRLPFREFTYGLKLDTGDVAYVRISGEPLFDQGVFRGYRGVGRDVTQATLAEQEVQRLARFDSLTGLPNRAMFMAELERMLARAGRGGQPFAILFIDLDRFKAVNDKLGHHAGDELLKTMANRLQLLLRGADMVARLGGDEFVVLVDGSVDPAALSKIASRALTTLAEPMSFGERQVEISGSVGICLYPADGQDASTLLRNADAAMYLAKARGKNCFQFFTQALADRAAALFALEGDLRHAIDHEELCLHFQPKFGVANLELRGFEVLIRWQHPQRGLLPPDEFIELAEESGLIVPMGRWLLDAVCRQLRTWQELGLAVPRCAINLSLRQFANAMLVEDMQAALARQQLPASSLEVEITESVLMDDPERVQQDLHRLRAMGIRITIDDFGTGYSSLTHLKRLPVDTLKIDRSFIEGLPADRDDQVITQTVIAMAHSLKLEVVAEGVETQAQLDLLRELRCDSVQGFLLGRPMPAEPFTRLLRPDIA